MIIDADTHVTLTETPGMRYEELLRHMDAAGVDKSVIWLAPPYMRHIGEANRYVYEAYQRHPDRFIPFGWADINLGLAQSRDEIRRCLDEYGMAGIKFNGAQNEYRVDRPEVFELAGMIAERGKAIAFHIGADYYDCTHPYRAAKVAREFPHTPFLFSHMGGAGLPDLTESCIEFALELDNISLIGSNVAYTRVLRAIGVLGSERVCFGSDSPFFIQEVELAAYRALLGHAGLTQREAADVLGNNAARLLINRTREERATG